MATFFQNFFFDLAPGLFYIAIFLLIYIETAIIVAFFIPGDTVLFTIGLIIGSSGKFNIGLACALVSLAAFLGDQSAYFFGKKFGIKFIANQKIESLDRMYSKSERFFQKYGVITILLSRFYPWMRTLVPFAAGVTGMRYRTFFAANLGSAIVWGSGITLLGYYASTVPFLKDSSRGIALFFIALTAIITARNYLTERAKKSSSVNRVNV